MAAPVACAAASARPRPVAIAWLADHAALAPKLAAWHHAEWGALMPDWSAAEAVAELIDHASRRTLPTTLVAMEGGHALGSVSVVAEDAVQFRDLAPWLASLYVVPAARGRGIGAALVEAAVALARDAGVARLHLFTPGDAGWYERLGWRRHGRRTLHGREVELLAIAPGGAHP